MYCSKCGSKIADDCAFCPRCGQKVVAPMDDGPKANASQGRRTNRRGGSPVLPVILGIVLLSAVYLIMHPEIFEDDSPTSTYATESTSESTSSSSSEDASGDASKPDISSFDVVTQDFAFNIPAYWKDRVEWRTWEENGYSHAIVYPKVALGYTDGYYLVSLDAVSPSTPDNAGDFIAHKIATVEDAGKRVDIHSKNWPAYYADFFYRNPGYGGSSQEHELINALVDLCCGGKSLPSVYNSASSASSAQEATDPYMGVDTDYLTTAFVPLVAIVDD